MPKGETVKRWVLALGSAMVLVAVALAAPALADDGRVGGEPGNVRVVASDDIRMEAETVQAVVYQRFAEYVVDFRFVNTGPEQQVRLGFPYALDEESAEPPVTLAGFLAYQDGKPLAVWATEGMDGPNRVGWFEHATTFPRGETTIRVRYATRPSVSAGLPEGVSASAPPRFRGMAGDSAWLTYTLHTGAGWADTIGRAVVRYTLAPDFAGWGFGASGEEDWGTWPPGFTRPDEATLQWVFEKFEPVPDARNGTSPYDIRVLYFEPWYMGWTESGDERAPDPQWAKPPLAGVTASSASVPEVEDPSVPAFLADKAADGDPASAWVSAPGARRPHWLRLTLGEPREAVELRIVPGYARTPDGYREHGRPKTIAVTLDDGTRTRLTLADEPTVQRFALPGHVTSEVRIDIESVYPGTVHDDVAVSEVEVASAAAPRFLSFEEALAVEGPVVTAEDLADAAAAEGEPETSEEGPAAEPASPADRSPGADFWIAVGAAVIGGSLWGGRAAAARVRDSTRRP